MKRRVVITGIGLVTPIGLNKETNWDNLINGRSGINKIRGFDASNLPVQIAGEVKGFTATDYMDKKLARKYSKFMQYSIAAAKEALGDSGINLNNVDRDRCGVVIGSGIGGLEVWENNHENFIKYGIKKVSPMFIPATIINNASGAVSIEFNFKGPNIAISTACATGLHSIGESYRMIQYGDADIILAGGSETTVTAYAITGFARINALSKRNNEPEKASRPFDKNRDGFVVSEGCGIIVLEELEHALKRKSDIYCEVVGYGMSSDAYHVTAPDPKGYGAMLCMKNAINDANIDPAYIDYINAHGTSTPYNDVIETKAIKSVFKEHAYKLKVSSSKSMTGHLIGATGGVEVAYTSMMMKYGKIAPTINLEEADDECDLDYVPNKALPFDINYAMSNSFGFGGTNACIVLKKYTKN
ncbi:MAG: beta-ketoacyl-ACP synthase II [Deferribacterota bacterium]|nr:beta-ketoacyl-ACP synthase II [Deferribacterota bacterium]